MGTVAYELIVTPIAQELQTYRKFCDALGGPAGREGKELTPRYGISAARQMTASETTMPGPSTISAVCLSASKWG